MRRYFELLSFRFMSGSSLKLDGDTIGVAAMVNMAGRTISTTESFRMIKQAAVKLDGKKI